METTLRVRSIPFTESNRIGMNTAVDLQSTAGAAEAGSEKEEALLRRAAMMAGIAALHPADCTIYSSMQTKAEAVSGARTLP